jgi:hypothetical protein
LKIDSQSKLTLVGLSHHFKELLSEQSPSALNVYPKTGRQRYFTFQSVQASLSFLFPSPRCLQRRLAFKAGANVEPIFIPASPLSFFFRACGK